MVRSYPDRPGRVPPAAAPDAACVRIRSLGTGLVSVLTNLTELGLCPVVLFAFALLLFCAGLATVLRWFCLLRLLLRLFLRPAMFRCLFHVLALGLWCACLAAVLRWLGCCFALVWLASAAVARVFASCCCFVACFMRLLFASVALAWLLFCGCLAAVLRWFRLLRLLLWLFLRPAAVSLLVSCACSWLVLRLPGCCFALAWLLFCGCLACFG